MSLEEFPPGLGEFILRHIDSVAHLEALLLLRADSDRAWSAEELAARLYTSGENAVVLLGNLEEQGFVDHANDQYRFSPGSAERSTLDDLAAFYASHIIPVTQLIHSKPRRIREFANAFRLKKDR